MKTIRFGVFETNSSSEHSVSLFNEKDIKDFKDGLEYYDSYGGFWSIKRWKDWISKNQKYNGITDEQLKQLFAWLISYVRNNEDVRGYYFNDFEEEFDKSFTEEMISFIKEIMEDAGYIWIWDTWGYGYSESDINEIVTPHGDKVYALSYSGYCD